LRIPERLLLCLEEVLLRQASNIILALGARRLLLMFSSLCNSPPQPLVSRHPL